MIRISTTKVRVGDHIRTYATEGIVTKVPANHGISFRVEVLTSRGTTVVPMRSAGTVELLSDLNGRIPAESFGRW